MEIISIIIISRLQTNKARQETMGKGGLYTQRLMTNKMQTDQNTKTKPTLYIIFILYILIIHSLAKQIKLKD